MPAAPRTDPDSQKFLDTHPFPGVPAGEWLMKLVDVNKHAYFVGEGVEYLLRQAFDWVYENTGYHNGRHTGTPTFFLARQFVQRQRLHGRMGLWQAGAMRVLESLCFRHGLGPVVNATTWDHEALLSLRGRPRTRRSLRRRQGLLH